MKIGIGIDTGGTYTDVVAYDYDTLEVITKNKTLTTKEDLTLCIERSLDFLGSEILGRATSISLSTTLATNACVEGRGGRAKLVLMGLTQVMADRIDMKSKYGIDPVDLLCLDTKGSFDGSVIDEPDWEQVIADNQAFFSDAQSIAISEVNALRNNALAEKNARNFLSEKLDVPIVIASDLASELNFIERGATALLNARLLPVISKFVEAVSEVLEKRGLDIPVMILRSDGSLMSKSLSRERPVETILSGPAASVIGGKGISTCDRSMIIDIGGTTTDISIVEDGKPAMTDSIKIGGWRTQVRGVFIDTYGLGGDSRVWIDDGKLIMSTKRVVPLCILASHEPRIIQSLETLREDQRKTVQPLHEFLYIVNHPESLDGFSENEKRIISLLENGPIMIGNERFDPYTMKPDRLEDEGIIMRCGITPTDIMHIKGDFERFDAYASKLALRYFAKNLYMVKTESDIEQAISKICDQIYTMAKKRLYKCIMYTLAEYLYPSISNNGISVDLDKLIDEKWDRAVSGDRTRRMLEIDFAVDTTLVGIGAPTHVLLPDVAKVMGVPCVIPQNAEVANAIGTAIADISAKVTVDISTKYDAGGLAGFVVHAQDENKFFEDQESAISCAIEEAKQQAIEEARVRGALGELKIATEVEIKEADTIYGDILKLGIKVYGYATGRISD